MATESFFSNASLAYLASAGAGKDGKAYSIKRTDGTGDFTFSRGSNLAATRIGSDGLIEKGRENLLLQSNQFDTTWVNYLTTETSGQSGYDGSSDAWLLTKSGANGNIYQNKSSSGVQTISVYAKKNTNSWLQIYAVGSPNVRAYYDLENGVLGGYVFNAIEREIEDVGNGWYRCSVTFNSSLSSIRLYPSDGNNDESGTSGSIYIQDAQVEIGLAATPYIESGATTGKAGLLEDEPRFDYSGGATCPSLLLEPSRTNLIPNSEYLIDGLTNVTATYNYGTSPDGLNNSTFILPSAAVAAHRIGYTDLFTYAPSTSYIASAFLKSGGHRYAAINLVLRNSGSFQETANGLIDLQENTIVVNGSNTLWTGIDVFKEEYANGFYRYGITAKTPSSGSDRVDVQFNITDENGNSFAGNGTDGVVFYGLQAESGSYATSYIPNHSGGSVTRGADGLELNPLDQSYGSESTWFFEAERLPSDDLLNQTLGIFTNSDAVGAVNRFVVNSTGNGRLRVSVYDENGISENLFSNTDVFVKGQTTKFALKIATGNIALFINGNDPITETGLGVITGIDRIVTMEDTILKQFLVFPEALSNEDCKNLTAL